MEQKIFKIEGYDFDFRIKNMKAVEVLAIKSQINFDDEDKAKKCFDTILEKFEVRCSDSWVPVKMKNAEVYFPEAVETDPNLVDKLVDYFIKDYLAPVFQKSSASND